MASTGAYERLRRELLASDPDIVAAADEIDQTLIDHALAMSPWERLQACSDTNRVLSGFKRVGKSAAR